MRVMDDAWSGSFDQERQVRAHQAADAMPTACGSPNQNDRVESVNGWSFGSESG
jgi:hypothetical protein